ncbi:MAG: ROK family protein [Kofleriaceae bacterium]
MSAPLRIGVDLGGSNLRIASLKPDSAALVEQHKEPTGEPRDPDTIVERIAALVERFAGNAGGPVPVGIGIAAMLRDRQGTVANSPHLRWRDVPFGVQLAKRLGSRFAVGVYNDVNAIVYGEHAFGAARGHRDVLGVYVGTGIGGGLVVNGALVEGANNCAGEIGHVKVRWDDAAAPCACGQRGCVEAYIGGSYVAKRIAAELGAGAASSAVDLAGGVEHVTPSHVDEAAGQGDPWALSLWEELAPLLAIALGNAIAVLNPERLVLGGGLLGRTPTLYEQVVTMLPLVAPVASMEPLTIAPAELGDDAGIVGAAALAASGVSIVRS